MKEPRDDFPTVNRHAVVLRPTDVFIEWARHTPDEAPEALLTHIKKEHTVYLIPESDSVDGPRRFLRRHFDEMFQHELWSWCTDPSTWPQNRTYAEFKKWFDVDVCPIVVDLGDDVLGWDW